MSRKRVVGGRVPAALADAFAESTERVYGQAGLCLSAALLMWLESDITTRERYLQRVYSAGAEGQIDALVEKAKKSSAVGKKRGG